jgi:5,6,7,8-tetrahydromethanopterin hydro-lyase
MPHDEPLPFAAVALIGESFAGSAPNAAHLNLVIGRKGGPVETAWMTALATPRAGHVPFLVTLRPNLPVKPATLFVNKADVRGERHETLTWGAAQAGVAAGIAQAVAEGPVPPQDVDDLMVIAAVWVSWTADDETQVFENNRRATFQAVLNAVRRLPIIEDVVAEADQPWNAYFRPR